MCNLRINVQYYSASVLFYVQIQCYRQLTECSDRTTSKCRLSACGSVGVFFLKFEGLTTTLRRRIAMIGDRHVQLPPLYVFTAIIFKVIK